MSQKSHAPGCSSRPRLLDRRMFLAAGSSFLSGCVAGPGDGPAPSTPTKTDVPVGSARLYSALLDEQYPIPAMDVSGIDPRLLRQEVAYRSSQRAGTIVVNTGERFLYLVLEGGRALRYGVGVGRDGFAWSGVAKVQIKKKWPTWTPPRSMIKRDPALKKYAGGMPPGLDNPLGARALYLFQNGRDTLYRLHGTNEPESIGRAVSSGCIRLFNHDIIDLYDRTPIGARVVVLDHREAA